MHNLYRFLLLMFVLSAILSAQEPAAEAEKAPEYGWKNDVVANLGFTQNRFENWSQGGENSWAWQFDLQAKFENDQEKYNWANSGKFSFGQAKIGEDDLKKAADEIRLETVLTFKIGSEHVNPYVAATALTQITPGYDYSTEERLKISDFMDPGYFTESAGIGYKMNDNFKTRFGASMKQTITNEFADRYAKGEKFRNEFGAESVSDLAAHLAENLVLNSKLMIFSNFKAFNQIDVDWDNVFKAKVTDLLNVTLTVRLLYDYDVSLKRQLKQTLAIGFSYDLL